MKKSLLLAISAIFLSFFSLIVSAATNAQANMGEQQKDGKILEVLILIDNNEINLAKQAEKKSTDANVKSFADAMLKDHSKNLENIEALAKKMHITPVSSNRINLLKRAGAEEIKALGSKQGKDFNVAYVDAMVKGHEKALKIIDEKLIPHTSNQELINLLNATKKTVSQHLEMAKNLQSKIAKT